MKTVISSRSSGVISSLKAAISCLEVGVVDLQKSTDYQRVDISKGYCTMNSYHTQVSFPAPCHTPTQGSVNSLISSKRTTHTYI